MLRDFRHQFNEVDADACVVVAMSHELRDELEMVDGRRINFWNELIYEFHPEKCPRLQNKPKIFIVNACQDFFEKPNPPRGSYICKGLPVDYSDILVIISALPGFESFRDRQTGSFFIGTLVEMFRRHARELEIQKMLRMVSCYENISALSQHK